MKNEKQDEIISTKAIQITDQILDILEENKLLDINVWSHLSVNERGRIITKLDETIINVISNVKRESKKSSTEIQSKCSGF